MTLGVQPGGSFWEGGLGERLEQVIYIDVLLAAICANFLFDWLLLWATAEVTKTSTTPAAPRRDSVWQRALRPYMLATYGLIGGYGLLRFPVTVALVSAAMLTVTFAPQGTARSLLRLAGTFYVILFVASGAGFALGNMLAYGGKANPAVVQVGAVLALVVTAETGWGVVQRRIWRQRCLVPVEIVLGGRVRLKALVDTGNSLTDPLSRAPVVVVTIGAIRPLFPEAVRDDLDGLVRGDFDRVGGIMLHHVLASRVRLIPFTSLGAENGLLVGFTPDRFRILLPKTIEISRRIVVAVAPQVLDPAGEYQGLLHPGLLEGAAQLEDAPLRARRRRGAAGGGPIQLKVGQP